LNVEHLRELGEMKTILTCLKNQKCAKITFFQKLPKPFHIQGDFERCADILTNDRTPQQVTIEPRMPYSNVDIFREKKR
jgi:hypothetical protein